ncbi:hypothetical protein ACGF07_20770 [Kitasatospora sp. NPDC048194]|uniref:hypothetical protein n=1 Tax=Kitasatospora sp. NPDC048194 TaxID=3364045 RepID=UPI0037211C43
MDRQEPIPPLSTEHDRRSGHRPDTAVRRFCLRLRSRAWDVTSGLRPRTVLALITVSVALLAVGLRASAEPLFWAFTGGWALALAVSFAVLCACAGPGRDAAGLPVRELPAEGGPAVRGGDTGEPTEP